MRGIFLFFIFFLQPWQYVFPQSQTPPIGGGVRGGKMSKKKQRRSFHKWLQQIAALREVKRKGQSKFEVPRFVNELPCGCNRDFFFGGCNRDGEVYNAQPLYIIFKDSGFIHDVCGCSVENPPMDGGVRGGSMSKTSRTSPRSDNFKEWREGSEERHPERLYLDVPLKFQRQGYASRVKNRRYQNSRARK